MTIRAVLVSRAGRGIGRAIAFRLAASGWDLFGGVCTEVAAKELNVASDLTEPVTLDATEPGQPAALDHLPDRHDALVNNAAVAIPRPIETRSRADKHRQSDANLVGPLAFTPTVLPRLRRGRGRVVFISSNGGVSYPITGLDNTSQSGADTAADCLRIRLRPFGVQVTLIGPGVVDTGPRHEMEQILDELEAGLDSERQTRHHPYFATERQRLPRCARTRSHPERVARAVERQLTRRRVRPRTVVSSHARAILGLKTLLPDGGSLDATCSHGTPVARAKRRGPGPPPPRLPSKSGSRCDPDRTWRTEAIDTHQLQTEPTRRHSDG